MQAQERSRAAASSDQPILPTTAQPMRVVPAMPEEVRKGPPTQVVQPAVAAPIQVATPVLPFTRSNPVKRSGSDDIEEERPARMWTPSPTSSLPPRPSSPQLSQLSQEQRVRDGYVRRHVAERDMLQLQQQHLNASSALRQEDDEKMRQGVALQQLEWLGRLIQLVQVINALTLSTSHATCTTNETILLCRESHLCK